MLSFHLKIYWLLVFMKAIICYNSKFGAIEFQKILFMNSYSIFKYWVGVQQGQFYLIGRKYLFSLGWSPF